MRRWIWWNFSKIIFFKMTKGKTKLYIFDLWNSPYFILSKVFSGLFSTYRYSLLNRQCFICRTYTLWHPRCSETRLKQNPAEENAWFYEQCLIPVRYNLFAWENNNIQSSHWKNLSKFTFFLDGQKHIYILILY